MKTCTGCQKDKPLSEFSKNKKAADGYVGKCRECINAYNRERNGNRRDAKNAALEQRLRTGVKVCFKCQKEKPLDAFHKHPQMADGYLNKCKDCACADVRKHREENDSVREYDNRRARENPERVAKLRAGVERRRKEHPEKRKAQTAVGNAVRDGRLIKPDYCSHCNQKKKRIEGHHEDYSKPLEVIWVCTLCHRRYY